MKSNLPLIILLALFTGFVLYEARTVKSSEVSAPAEALADFDAEISSNAKNLINQGRRVFRFDTFGDQVFWGDTLRLHEALAKVSPREALALGLKVDVAALPRNLVRSIKRGEVNLNDPAVTA